jgi:uncharacterized protein
MAQENYVCAKCKNTTFETAEIRTTGSGLSRFLNLQNQKFAAITCSECAYTELYRMRPGSRAASVLDVLTN